jgi:hypothetical protein
MCVLIASVGVGPWGGKGLGTFFLVDRATKSDRVPSFSGNPRAFFILLEEKIGVKNLA